MPNMGVRTGEPFDAKATAANKSPETPVGRLSREAKRKTKSSGTVAGARPLEVGSERGRG